MNKWPKIILIAFCLCIATSIVIGWHFRQKKEKTVVSVEYNSVTWSGFEEYKRLQMLLKGFGIESLIDIPSLDLQELTQHDLGLKHYIGVTNSKDQARAMQVQFGNELRKFFCFEITVDTLPKADLILCWDVLNRLPQSKILAALLQFKKSGAKFLLMRHYSSVQKNHKNKEGVFQPINWRLPPYHFPEPIIQIVENQKENLALWSLEDL